MHSRYLNKSTCRLVKGLGLLITLSGLEAVSMVTSEAPSWTQTSQAEVLMERRKTRFNVLQLEELFQRGRPKKPSDYGPPQEAIPYKNSQEAKEDLHIAPVAIGYRNKSTGEVFLTTDLPLTTTPKKTLQDITDAKLPPQYRDTIINYTQCYLNEASFNAESMMPKLIRLAFSSHPKDLYASFLLLRYEPQLQEWRSNFYRGGSLTHFGALPFPDLTEEFNREANECTFKNSKYHSIVSNANFAENPITPESLGLWYFRAGTLFLYTSSFQKKSHDFLIKADRWFQRSIHEHCPLGACGGMLLNLISLTSQDNAEAAYYLSRLEWDANLPSDPGLTSSTTRWCDDFARIAQYLGHKEPTDYEVPQGQCWQPQDPGTDNFQGDFVDFVGYVYPEIHRRPLHIDPQHLQELHKAYLYYVQGYSPGNFYDDFWADALQISLPIGAYTIQVLGRDERLLYKASGYTPTELATLKKTSHHIQSMQDSMRRISTTILPHLSNYPYPDQRLRPLGAFYNFFFHATLKILPFEAIDLLKNFEASGQVPSNIAGWTNWDHPTPGFSLQHSRSYRVWEEICPVAHGNTSFASFLSRDAPSHVIRHQANQAHQKSLTKRRQRIEKKYPQLMYADVVKKWQFHTAQDYKNSQEKPLFEMPDDSDDSAISLMSELPYGLNYPAPKFPLPKMGPAAGLISNRYHLIIPSHEEIELCDWPPLDANDSMACFAPFQTVNLTRKFVADTFRVWGVHIDPRYDAGDQAKQIANKWDSLFVGKMRPIRQQAYLAGCTLVEEMSMNHGAVSCEDRADFQRKKLQEYEAAILHISREIDKLIQQFKRQTTYVVGSGDFPGVHRFFLNELYHYWWHFVEKEQRLGWARFYRNLALGRQEAVANFVHMGRNKQNYYISTYQLQAQDQSPWQIAGYRTARDMTDSFDFQKTFWEIPQCIQDSYLKLMWTEEQKVFHGVPRNAPILAVTNPGYFNETSIEEEAQILWFHPHHDNGPQRPQGRLLVRRSPYAYSAPQPHAPPQGETDFYRYWPTWQGRSYEEMLAITVPSELQKPQNHSHFKLFERAPHTTNPAFWDLATYEGRLAYNRYITSCLPTQAIDLLKGNLFSEELTFEEALSQQGRCLSLGGPSLGDIRALADAHSTLTWDSCWDMKNAREIFIQHPEAKTVCAISAESSFGGRSGEIFRLVIDPSQDFRDISEKSIKIITSFNGQLQDFPPHTRPSDVYSYPCWNTLILCASGYQPTRLLPSQRMKFGADLPLDAFDKQDILKLQELISLYTDYQAKRTDTQPPILTQLPYHLQKAVLAMAKRIHEKQPARTGEAFITTRWDHKSHLWGQHCCQEKVAQHHWHIAHRSYRQSLKLQQRFPSLITADELGQIHQNAQESHANYITHHHRRRLLEALLQQRSHLIFSSKNILDIPAMLQKEMTHPIPYAFFDPSQPLLSTYDTLLVATRFSPNFIQPFTLHPLTPTPHRRASCDDLPSLLAHATAQSSLTLPSETKLSSTSHHINFSNAESLARIPNCTSPYHTLQEVANSLYSDLQQSYLESDIPKKTYQPSTLPSPSLNNITAPSIPYNLEGSSDEHHYLSLLNRTPVDIVLLDVDHYEDLPQFLTIEQMLYLNIEEGDVLTSDHERDIVMFNALLKEYHQQFLHDHPGTEIEREDKIRLYRREANRMLGYQGSYLISPHERNCLLSETVSIKQSRLKLYLESNKLYNREPANIPEWHPRFMTAINVIYDPRSQGYYWEEPRHTLFSGFETWRLVNQDRITLARRRLEDFQFEEFERRWLYQRRLYRFMSTPLGYKGVRSPFAAPCSTPTLQETDDWRHNDNRFVENFNPFTPHPHETTLPTHNNLPLNILSYDQQTSSRQNAHKFENLRKILRISNPSHESISRLPESSDETASLRRGSNLNRTSNTDNIPAYLLANSPTKAEILPDFLLQKISQFLDQNQANSSQLTSSLATLGRLMMYISHKLDSQQAEIPEVSLEQFIQLSEKVTHSLKEFCQQQAPEGITSLASKASDNDKNFEELRLLLSSGNENQLKEFIQQCVPEIASQSTQETIYESRPL